jgi:hypothetical protein
MVAGTEAFEALLITHACVKIMELLNGMLSMMDGGQLLLPIYLGR